MKKTTAILLIIVTCISLACNDNKIQEVRELAGNNWKELQKVLKHYKEMGDKQKYQAAEFLISNLLYEKYSYEGDIISKYDTILYMYEALRRDSIYTGDPENIKHVWDSIEKKHGKIEPTDLSKKLDCQTLTAPFLIRNIDAAFLAWRNSPFYNPFEFDDFCEYILPYRVGTEKIENDRNRYYALYKTIVDTAKSTESMIKSFNDELMQKQQYRSSKLLWDYPLDFSASQIEIAHRGSCRQLTVFGAQIYRSCGIPVAIDRAIWANRSLGHTWNVILLDSGKIFPFDALERRKLEFSYKPAKIFRTTFSYKTDNNYLKLMKDIPAGLMINNEIDVTNEYINAFDVSIPLFDLKEFMQKKYVVICVFDNKNWRIVYYGKIINIKALFEKMASNVVYIAAFYDKGSIIPASNPFMLRENGDVKFCNANLNKLQSLKLNRKYPRLKKIEMHAEMGLKDSYFEASNSTNFNNSVKFFTINKVPYQITDSFVENTSKFRYIRFCFPKSKNANIAEIEFYGKKSINNAEEKLIGKIIGAPLLKKKNENPFTDAMDGNLETWFDKSRDTLGFVGLDLGANRKRIITRVRFCPRSDTNFILEGDKYELFYWDKDWKSAGSQIAMDTVLIFDKIPSETI